MKMLLIDLELLERCQTETREVLFALPELAPGLKQIGIAKTAGVAYQTLRSFMSGRPLSPKKLRMVQDALITRGVIAGEDIHSMTFGFRIEGGTN